ncbi:hypothetical protein ABZ897_35305 [Nonomuraea sp. NPDC046802]|uniref:hypothetical protein n=1 Tax=Nonomuraea sp. NPDC046802 TaxID=3154919 RepID=UPI003405FC0D
MSEPTAFPAPPREAPSFIRMNAQPALCRESPIRKRPMWFQVIHQPGPKKNTPYSLRSRAITLRENMQAEPSAEDPHNPQTEGFIFMHATRLALTATATLALISFPAWAAEGPWEQTFGDRQGGVVVNAEKDRITVCDNLSDKTLFKTEYTTTYNQTWTVVAQASAAKPTAPGSALLRTSGSAGGTRAGMTRSSGTAAWNAS